MSTFPSSDETLFASATERPGDRIGPLQAPPESRRSRVRHRYLEEMMPPPRCASTLTPLVFILVSCGLTGCASIGGAGLVGLTMLGAGIAASDRDELKADQQLRNDLEAELRPLLPPKAHATTPDANRLSVTGTPDNSLSVTAVGDFDPESTQKFIAGVRTLAWRHAFDLQVEIFTVRRSTAAAPDNNSLQPSNFFLSLWGYTKVERCRLSPRTEVAQKLGPLLPRSATHAKNIWGSDRTGEVFLVPRKPLIVAAADFSPTTAREFINQAKLAFPGIAIAVYRDVTKAPEGWQPVATYAPPLPSVQPPSGD